MKTRRNSPKCGKATSAFAEPLSVPHRSMGTRHSKNAFSLETAENLSPRDVIFLPIFASDFVIDAVRPDYESGQIELRGAFTRGSGRYRLALRIYEPVWKLDK